MINKDDILKDLEERIIHCDERIDFWGETHPNHQQVWKGVKVELERVKPLYVDQKEKQ